MQYLAVNQRSVWHSPKRGRGAPSRQIQTTIRNNASSQNSNQSERTPLQLPGGEHWWLGVRNDSAIIYGDSFVIQRPKVGGEGLVVSSKQTFLEKFSPRPAAPPAVRPRMPLGLTKSLSGMVVVDTVCEEVIAPNTSCTGIVYLGGSSNEDDNDNPLGAKDIGASFGKHPRRTRRMRYTCNLCGEVNEKEVNPRAWTKGSVFARCECCLAVHKLKDNLKIFHELKGPVFPPRDMRGSFPAVQEILDRIEAKKRLLDT